MLFQKLGSKAPKKPKPSRAPKWLRKGVKVTTFVHYEVTDVMPNGWVWMKCKTGFICQHVRELGKTWKRAAQTKGRRP